MVWVNRVTDCFNADNKLSIPKYPFISSLSYKECNNENNNNNNNDVSDNNSNNNNNKSKESTYLLVACLGKVHLKKIPKEILSKEFVNKRLTEKNMKHFKMYRKRKRIRKCIPHQNTSITP